MSSSKDTGLPHLTCEHASAVVRYSAALAKRMGIGASELAALVAAWLRGGGLGLLLDLAALVMFAGGVFALLVARRARRSPGGTLR